MLLVVTIAAGNLLSLNVIVILLNLFAQGIAPKTTVIFLGEAVYCLALIS